MRVVRIDQAGPAESMRVVQVDDPAPRAGELVVRMAVAGVNFADVQRRSGTYPVAVPYPFVPGIEVAGVVAQAGPGVPFKEGERVAGIVEPGGAYADLVKLEAKHAVPIPSGVSFEQAVGLLIQGLTAKSLTDLVSSRLHDRAWVMVTAAAGGVGSLLLQLAARGGARVLGAVGSAGKMSVVSQLGAIPVDTSQSDWPAKVRQQTEGQGVDVIFDGVNGNLFTAAAGLLGRFGCYVIFGAASDVILPITAEQVGKMVFNNQAYVGHSLGGRLAAEHAWYAPAMASLFEQVMQGRLVLNFHPAFALTDAVEAHRALESRRTTGKVILTAC